MDETVDAYEWAESDLNDNTGFMGTLGRGYLGVVTGVKMFSLEAMRPLSNYAAIEGRKAIG